MKPLPLVLVSLCCLAALGAGPCRGIPVFLSDADVDDDGVVTQEDVTQAAACVGAEFPLAPVTYNFYGCPERPEPDATGCEAADFDRNGRVTVGDVAAIAGRLGEPVCNGATELCDRSFDQMAFATTHNAPSAHFPPYSYSFLASNQCSGVPTQLEDGIRALMIDIHLYFPPEADGEDLYLCHADCVYGYQLLVDGLVEIREFLDANPGEVIAFIVETSSDTSGMEDAIRDAFAASGILAYAHVQTPGTPWPTIGEMIAANQRLVVLTDDSSPHALCDAGGAPCPWYHYLWSSFAFETPFQARRASEFTCADLRGEPGNDLFILNHFLTRTTGFPAYAQEVNHDFLLSERARECWEYQGRIPNFITVDYHEIGGVVRVTNLLNYLWQQTGGSAP
jgi:hypothetical protein